MFLVPMTRNANELARSFDRLFDDGFERFYAPTAQTGNGNGSLRSPALDVPESDHAYTVKLDLPGVAKEDVKIAIDGRRISVEAQTRKEEQKKEGERSMSSHARSFTVAADIDQAESAAKMESGVLTLNLAKRGASSAAQPTVS